MEKYFLFLLCSKGADLQTQLKCAEVLKQTIKNFQIYQSIKEKEKEYRELAEHKLTKTGFWISTTLIATASTRKLYLTGHNFMGTDAINLKLDRKEVELGVTWTF